MTESHSELEAVRCTWCDGTGYWPNDKGAPDNCMNGTGWDCAHSCCPLCFGESKIPPRLAGTEPRTDWECGDKPWEEDDAR